MSKRSEFRQDLIDITCIDDDDTLTFLEGPEFDLAIIGICHRPGQPDVLAYDEEKIINIFIKDGMSEEEAIEFYDYSTVRGIPYMGKSAPVIITTVEQPKGSKKSYCQCRYPGGRTGISSQSSNFAVGYTCNDCGKLIKEN